MQAFIVETGKMFSFQEDNAKATCSIAARKNAMDSNNGTEKI